MGYFIKVSGYCDMCGELLKDKVYDAKEFFEKDKFSKFVAGKKHRYYKTSNRLICGKCKPLERKNPKWTK